MALRIRRYLKWEFKFELEDIYFVHLFDEYIFSGPCNYCFKHLDNG